MQQVAAPGTLTALTASGPLVVTGSGRVIEGLKISNPNGPCIDIRAGASDITIRDNEIGPCKDDGIRIDGARDVRILHNHIHDTTTTLRKTDTDTGRTYTGTDIDGNGIEATASQDLSIERNYIRNVTSGLTVFGDTSARVVFHKNVVIDVHMDRSRVSIPRIGGQMIQIAHMADGAGTRITCNLSDQQGSTASVEDHVNLYSVRGTPQTPVLVAYNKLLGASLSISGAGIQMGDGGGAYLHAFRNNLYNAGSVGASIAGGTGITIEQNKILHSDDYVETHPGAWPSAIKTAFYGQTCTDNRVVDNRLDTLKPGDGGVNIMDSPQCTRTVYAGNLEGPAAGLTSKAQLEDAAFTECR